MKQNIYHFLQFDKKIKKIYNKKEDICDIISLILIHFLFQPWNFKHQLY